MKRIQLHTARPDNSGVRREAGAIVPVGSGRNEIAVKRARALVNRREAAVLPGAEVEDAAR